MTATAGLFHFSRPVLLDLPASVRLGAQATYPTFERYPQSIYDIAIPFLHQCSPMPCFQTFHFQTTRTLPIHTSWSSLSIVQTILSIPQISHLNPTPPKTLSPRQEPRSYPNPSLRNHPGTHNTGTYPSPSESPSHSPLPHT